MRVLITGASGFIGSRLARSLQANGHDVIGLARSPATARQLESMGIGAVRGDLGRPSGLRRAVQGARPDAVAHLAAAIATTRDPGTIRAVNIEGTRALAEACRGLELRRFLFLSSVVVGQPAGAVLSEDRPLIATTAYGRSKLDGEVLLQDEHRTYGLPVTVLRPSHVYGAGGWYESLVRDIVRNRFMVPGAGTNLWDMVHVDDAVSAAKLLLEAGDGRIRSVYHVVDDAPITMKDFVALTCRELGRRPPLHVPVFIARLVAGRGPVDAAVRSARSTNRRLREDFGWTPQYGSSEQGIPPSIGELREAGVV